MRLLVLGALAIAGCTASVPPPPATQAPPPPKVAVAPVQPAVTPAKPDATPPKPDVTPAKPDVTPAKPDITPAKPVVTPAKPVVALAKAGAQSPPAVAKAPAPAPLDLKSLEQRLKESDAIGVLTKLSLKNQVDDLIQRFRAFHGGQRPPTLTQLRPDFELLLMKVLSLLQDKDSRLARDIDTSREAIWSVLADPSKLATYAS
jgi:hypothetical protein